MKRVPQFHKWIKAIEAIFPLTWRKCDLCGLEFRWEIGYISTTDSSVNGIIDANLTSCSHCTPSKADFARALNMALTKKETLYKPMSIAGLGNR